MSLRDAFIVRQHRSGECIEIALIPRAARTWPLPVALIQLDSQDVRPRAEAGGKIVEQAAADVAGQEFGGRVRDRQELAIAARKFPAAILKRDLDAPIGGLHLDRRVPGRQQRVVIQVGDDRSHGIAQGKKSITYWFSSSGPSTSAATR